MKFNIIKQFLPDIEISEFSPLGNGHINSTFLVKTSNNDEYVLQRINDYVFKDVEGLMNNIDIITNHLKNKKYETLEIVRTIDKKLFIEDDGSFYRMYKFVLNSFTYEKIEDLDIVRYSADAYGKFHKLLADLDVSKIKETIPHFHDTPKRYADFLKTVEKDEFNNVKNCHREIDLINNNAAYLNVIEDKIKTNELKTRIIHNDPKINNALFDKKTKELRCVIDLDTTMPGTILYDFGDALRSLFTGDKEDSFDFESVVGDKVIFEEYLKSYYAQAKDFLTEQEIELLPYAPIVMALELTIRFLDDYIGGNKYFPIKYENHNLVRARTQLNLAISLINDLDEYKKITNKIINY